MSSTRLPALDSLRGVLLSIMAINHIPSDLRALTDQPLGYVSAAEGFVFLSGLLAGKVYFGRARSVGARNAALDALARALVIYRAHLVCIVLAFGWSVAFRAAAGTDPAGAPALFLENPLLALPAAALFVYRPGLFDILPLYCVALVLLAAMLRFAQRGRDGLVLAASGLVWALANLFGGREPYVHGLINTGAIAISAWQFLFVLGCVIGSRWGAGTLRLPLASARATVVLAAIALGLMVLRHDWGVSLPPSAAGLVVKLSLAPLRLINILIVAYLLALAIRARPRGFACAPLEFLGRNSLPVFTAHVVGALIVLSLGDWLAHDVIGRAVGAAMLFAMMFLTAYVAEASGERFRRRAVTPLTTT